MSAKTGIEWCDSTVNPITGCDGCELWAELLASGRLGGPCYAGNYHEQRLARAWPGLYSSTFTEVRLVPGRMAKAAALSDLAGTKRPDKPWLDGFPRVIFVEDMGDLFSKAVPFEFIQEEVIHATQSIKGRRHIYMLLTKQPHRMSMFAGWLKTRGIRWPANVWAGTSITTQKTTTRVRHLRDIPAAVRFVSLEPQLGEIDPAFIGRRCSGCGLWNRRGAVQCQECDEAVDHIPDIHLVIQGGESDQLEHRARPFDIAWAASVRDQCVSTGTYYFLKQLGSHVEANDAIDAADYFPGVVRLSEGKLWGNARVHLQDHHGGDWSEWPPDLRVRQMPEWSTDERL
jgi:protein gp37